MLRKIDDRVFLVGVAHVLPRSVEEVRKVIREEKPEIVAVELCPYRYAILSGQLTPSGRPPIGNPLEFIFNWGLGFFQSRLAKRTGSTAGREMVVAVEEARLVGSKIELIDRDIRVTLARLNSSISLLQRVRLFLQTLASGFFSGGEVDLSQLDEDRVVEHLILEFKRFSPAAYRVLIEERDEHMIQRLAPHILEGRKLVCVVGAGHLPGLQRGLQAILTEWKRKIWWRGTIEFETGC